MDLLSISIGSVVAKWALRLWSQDTKFEGLGEDLVSIVPQIFTDRMECRSVTRQFDALIDDVAKRVDPYIGTEITGADLGERTAAGYAVEKSLRAALLTSADLIDLDFDPIALNRWIRDRDPDAADRAGLSEAGTSIYDTLLSDSSSWIVATAGALPGVRSQATAELLSRDTEIIALLRNVLGRIPESSLPAEWGRGSADTVFENEYRKSVSRYSDRLQLFGVESATAKSIYSLSVAYISMSVGTGQASESGAHSGDLQADVERPEKEGSEQSGYMRVEHAIGNRNHILISGDAGSGKTTLLRWLALQSVTNAHSDALASWNQKIPFLVPLRSYVDAAMPSPEKFIELIAPNLLGAMPQAWPHRVLAAGRAVVLIDGLDEIPSLQRSEALRWLDDLTQTFPNNKYLVTARPTAISEEWKALPSFYRADLLPMEHADIRAFITHWHAAAAKGSSSESAREEIRKSEKMILNVVRDKLLIRTLCTSPLLCALVCALNIDRAGQIPDNRMELYATALKMLVVHRDEARRIAVDRSVALDYAQAEILLRSFAQWLHENGRADAERAEFEQRIAKQLITLHRVRGGQKQVSEHLLARSGVLREPVPGRVDFVHRSFLEYLAALAIVEDDSVHKLVLHAHEDHWREVVIMAAGHAKLTDREALINGIIDRGRDEPPYTHRLYLLAVACMETSPELGVDVQNRLRACLREVIPPHNMTEAAAVASAGSIAVEVLRRQPALATESAASVRALSLIGGDAALQAMKTYRQDTRVTVSRELIRAWSSFDAEEFAKEVLSESILDRGDLRVVDPESFRYLHHLKNLGQVQMEGSGLEFALSKVSSTPVPIRFDFSYSSTLKDLDFLQNFPNTIGLDLRFCRFLTDLSGLRTLENLDRIDLEGCSGVTALSELESHLKLVFLDVSKTSVKDVSPATRSRHLNHAILNDCQQLVALGDVLEATSVSIRDCPNLVDYSALERATSVRHLNLGNVSPAVREIGVPKGVLSLRLGGNGDLISGAADVEYLSIDGSADIGSCVRAALKLPSLKQIELRGKPSDAEAADIRALSEHPTLTRVDYWSYTGANDSLSIPGYTSGGYRARRYLVRH